MERGARDKPVRLRLKITRINLNAKDKSGMQPLCAQVGSHFFGRLVKHDHVACSWHHLLKDFEMCFCGMATLESIENKMLKIRL